MAIAANAVADLIAPPPAANSKPAPNDPADTSFDDHLDAAAEKDAPKAKAAPGDDDDAPDEAQATDATDSAACATPPSPQPEPTPAPVLLQLIAAAPEAPAPQTATPDAAPVEAAAPVAPTAPVAPETPAAAADEDAPEAPVAARTEEPHAKSETKSAPVAQQEALQVATATPDATPIATPAPTATPAPVTAEVQQAVQAVAMTTPAPTQTQSAREAAPRTTKAAPSADAKSDTTVREPKTDAPQRTAQKDNDGKSAPAAIAGKEANVPAATARDVGTPAPAAIALATQTNVQTQHAVLDQTAARAAPVAAQVGHEIVRRFNGGSTHFDMRLDPPELGRVDVRLEVSRDHRVTAVVSADSPQALTELARHARELEQTLQSAGLELSDAGLSFDLRQGSEGAEQPDNSRGGSAAAQGSDDAPQEPTLRAQPLGMERWRGMRVDVMV